MSSFNRPAFSPLPAEDSGTGSLISSLAGLIEHNAAHNSDHIFCWQAETLNAAEQGQYHTGDQPFQRHRISFKDLERAVEACATWINEYACENNTAEARVTTAFADKPIALYLESDVGLFFHLAALLALNVPVLLLSARLGAEAVAHLLRETNSSTVLVSPRTRAAIDGRLGDSFRLLPVQPYIAYLNASPNSQLKRTIPMSAYRRRVGEKYAMILHSSGTTGLPKPIPVGHDYPLRYAACHRFSPEEATEWTNISTLPLYHGFGLLAPCLSLSLGMSCVFPPSSVIPTGYSTLKLIREFDARSLMTVPSTVEDMLSLSENEQTEAIKAMSDFEFLAVGGGALKAEHGATLERNNIKLLNHYGVTEIGAIAPIFRPTADYDWRYLRLRDDIGLALHPVEGTANWKLCGPSADGDGIFEIQDLMERRENSRPEHIEVRIKGRMDDLIVLKSGEKVRPQQLEDKLHQIPWIKTAVVVGSGHFEVVVLIEPVDPRIDRDDLIGRVWEQVSRLNNMLDAHAIVSSRLAIIPKPDRKPFPRSDKGSILRTIVHEDFKEEIEAAYGAMKCDVVLENVDLMALETEPEAVVRLMVSSVTGDRIDAKTLGIHDDLYQRGLDSLQTLRLARMLNAALTRLDPSSHVSPEFVYRNPSIKQLADASSACISARVPQDPMTVRGRAASMEAVVTKIGCQIAQAPERRPKLDTQPSYTVLLTGSTGSLGTHSLCQLVRDKRVAKVICCHRNSGGPAGDAAQARQINALMGAGLELVEEEWAKVEVVEGLEMMQKTLSGETDKLITSLAKECTHILHLAWPMDFQRTLSSFEPHCELIGNLVELCRRAHMIRPSTRVRMIFTSSIAAVRYSEARTANGSVPEIRMTDPSSAAPIGYAEGKWVCEALLQDAAETYHQEIDPVVVRVGQLSGPECSKGLWNPSEHVPALLQASQRIGAIPLVDGTVSWLPADRAAACLCEMLLHQDELPRVLHLENPVRQPFRDLLALWSRELGLDPRTCTLPFDDWLHKAVEVGALRFLEGFFENHFRELAHGSVVLDTTKARAVSKTLREADVISTATLLEYVRRWRQAGVLV